jgi:preprotein translocase subunit SecD
LQLRLVDSSTDGPRGESGTTTYHVGASLGEVTPTAVTYPGGQAERQVFTILFDEAGSVKLGDITRAAVGKQLAILVAGQVLSAAHVADPITGGRFELATTTPAEATEVAAALHASATS